METRLKTGLSDYYIHQNWAGAVFVKEGSYFREQGGESEPWGQAWCRVLAGSLADAKVKAPRIFEGPPPVVCICGSTRFIDTWNEWRQKLTLAGEIVLAIEIVTTQTREQDPQYSNPDVKAALDNLHKRKIDLADYVFVLNVGGYIGESTRSEIDYATACGKPVWYLEPDDQP